MKGAVRGDRGIGRSQPMLSRGLFPFSIPLYFCLSQLEAQVPASARYPSIDSIVESAIAERAFPGAVVAIGRRDTVLYLKAFGRLDYERGAAVTSRTIYDIASLTKVVGLTTAVMMLVGDGSLQLDQPVPGLDSAIRLRHLLAHHSGLPAWRPYYLSAAGREDLFAMAAAEPLEAPVGTRMVYSDIGVINLTRLVESVAGQRLDRFLARRLFTPLAMRDTRYLPPRALRPRIAPTERDTTWRRRLIHGEVHDENAHAMGGISGHAGLFSTAPDLARFAQAMLSCRARGSNDGGIGGSASTAEPDCSGTRTRRAAARGVPGLYCEVVQRFTQRVDSAFSSRALGWDTPDGSNSAGSLLSPRAFGHTGFTGTSIWIDPERDLFIILLTNRVHPTRENHRVYEVRRRVADAAVRATAVP